MKKKKKGKREEKKKEKEKNKNLTTQTLPAQLHVRSYVFSLDNIFPRI